MTTGFAPIFALSHFPTNAMRLAAHKERQHAARGGARSSACLPARRRKPKHTLPVLNCVSNAYKPSATMLSAKATVLPAAAAIGQLQRRTPCLAPCHAAAAAATGGRPAALSCSPRRAALAGATAPRHRRRSARVSASAGGGGSDLESEGLEQQSFSHLAKAVANKLAETAGQEGAYNGLKLWCVPVRVCGGVRQPHKLAVQVAC